MLAFLATVMQLDLRDEYRMAVQLERSGVTASAEDVRMDISHWSRYGPEVGDIHVRRGDEWFTLQHTYSSMDDVDEDDSTNGAAGPSAASRYPYGLLFVYDPRDHTVVMAYDDMTSALDSGPMPSGAGAVALVGLPWLIAVVAVWRWWVWWRRARAQPLVGRHSERDDTGLSR